MHGSLKNAIQHHKNGNIVAAKKMYESILRISSDVPDAYHNLALILWDEGKKYEALNHFKQAIEATEPNPVHVKSLLRCFYNLGDYRRALKYVRLATRAGCDDSFLKLLVKSCQEKLDISREIAPPSKWRELLAAKQYQKILVELENDRLYSDLSSFELHVISICYSRLKKPRIAFKWQSKLLRCAPLDPSVYNNIGISLIQLGKKNLAVRYFNFAQILDPSYVPSGNNLAKTLFELGELEKCRNALKSIEKICEGDVDYLNTLGRYYFAIDNTKLAIETFNKGLSISPNSIELLYNLGHAYQSQGDLKTAASYYLKVINIDPKFTFALNNLGIILKGTGRKRESISFFKRAVASDANNFASLNNLGAVYLDIGDFESAKSNLLKALAIKPNYSEAHNNLGLVMVALGDKASAATHYKAAIQIHPNYGAPYRHLTLIDELKPYGKWIEVIENQLIGQELSNEDRCQLSFALSKLYENEEQYKLAYDHVVTGNSLRIKTVNYSFNEELDKLDLCRHAIKKYSNLITRNSDSRYQSTCPIFILGMPRSGSSLTEQILSSHSNVYAGGELNLTIKFGEKLAQGNVVISEKSLNEFRASYLNELTELSDGARYATDKLPENFRFAALIMASIPEAKIIHTIRDPRAVCWSIFKTYFSSNSMSYSSNLEWIVDYYHRYLNIIDELDKKFPGAIFHLDYEDLVVNTETNVRAALEYIGIDFEESCLAPHLNKRYVPTASNLQVIKPIYTNSSDAWRKFEKFLGGAFSDLQKYSVHGSNRLLNSE